MISAAEGRSLDAPATDGYFRLDPRSKNRSRDPISPKTLRHLSGGGPVSRATTRPWQAARSGATADALAPHGDVQAEVRVGCTI
jgi:hypothetical protein